MDNKEFKKIRKRLEKTQKEMAGLLGISIKAVCSYEQGWRTIPMHVERQSVFLLARKINRGKKMENCWDIKGCTDNQKKQCPAWEFDAGRFCWFISGTICHGSAYKNWNDKFKVCKSCTVLKRTIAA